MAVSKVLVGRTRRVPFSPFWYFLWPAMLAFTWLLPTHYLPWTGFHPDAWMALVAGLGMAFIFLRRSEPLTCHWLTAAIGVLATVPLLQLAVGLLPFSGQALASSLYLSGFWLALMAGARHETQRPGEMMDGLLLAIGMASALSVGLQLHQWFRLDGLDIWSMGYMGNRPYGNLGQPNQLATLLLWGVLASGWGFVTGRVRPLFAVAFAAFLLFGVALTQSRTAWLGLMLIVAAAWLWRGLWSSCRLPWVVTGLGLFFVLCVMAVQWVGQLGDLLEVAALEGRMENEARLAVWRLFIDAALQQPWLGYGWSSVAPAQLAVALEHPRLHGIFAHSHNLFIDLVLWLGIPLGLLVSGGLLAWLISILRRVRTAENAILLLLLFVVGNHAMLELPLHYAYFLLPAGFVMGALNARLGSGPVLRVPQWTVLLAFAVAAMVYGALVRDYLQVEENLRALRFEQARIGSLPPAPAPEVLVLTDLRARLVVARTEPVTGMASEELDYMRKVARAYPAAPEVYRLASALALNQQEAEARLWIQKLCRMSAPAHCKGVQQAWEAKTGLHW